MKHILIFWRKQAQKAVDIQLTVILYIIYFVIMAPAGIWYKIQKNINIKDNKMTNWQDWEFTKTDEETKEM